MKEEKLNREESSIEKGGMRGSNRKDRCTGESRREKSIKKGNMRDGRETKRSSLMSGIKDSLTASLCIQAVILPAIFFYYYELRLYSVFLNLIIIPLMGLLLVFVFAGNLLCLFWQGGGSLCLHLCGWILKLYELL